MSLIRFKNSTEDNNIKVILSVDSSDRIKITFLNETEIPVESTLLSGFVELNEHNFIEQSDFSDMNYLYLKIDKLTYILTKNKNDVYVQPETSDNNYSDFIPGYTPSVDDIDEVRNMKISSLSSICSKQIVNGVDINIDGVLEHFSYTEEDQTNIKELFDLAVQTNVPMYYHSDGNSCKLYTIEQIVEIYTTATMNKMHHITYFNQLKMYLNSLDDLDTIKSISYGHELTDEYLAIYNSAMEQAKVGMKTLLKAEYMND